METVNNDIRNKFSDMLIQASWTPVFDEEAILEISKELTVYKKRFQDSCDDGVDCYAWVSADRQGMEFDGHLGILWIEAIHENALPYSYKVLTDMRNAIECAEFDLLIMHVPFSSKCKFHGEDAGERTKLNKQIRSSWGLDEVERKLRNTPLIFREIENE